MGRGRRATARRVRGHGLSRERNPLPQPSPCGRGSSPPMLQLMWITSALGDHALDCTAMDAKQSLTNLWHDLRLPAEALEHISLTGADPALPSSFHVGQMAQVSIGATALAAAELH